MAGAGGDGVLKKPAEKVRARARPLVCELMKWGEAVRSSKSSLAPVRVAGQEVPQG